MGNPQQPRCSKTSTARPPGAGRGNRACAYGLVSHTGHGWQAFQSAAAANAIAKAKGKSQRETESSFCALRRSSGEPDARLGGPVSLGVWVFHVMSC